MNAQTYKDLGDDLEQVIDQYIEEHGPEILWTGMFNKSQPISLRWEQIRAKVKKQRDAKKGQAYEQERSRSKALAEQRESDRIAQEAEARKEKRLQEAIKNVEAREAEEAMVEQYRTKQ